jgi:hypothetical protein
MFVFAPIRTLFESPRITALGQTLLLVPITTSSTMVADAAMKTVDSIFGLFEKIINRLRIGPVVKLTRF